ncbi:MAG: hypothetical protein GXO27_02060 [Chlorobi bacterium]|nr:hypothetical protein [Chlorobiota bacterium]
MKNFVRFFLAWYFPVLGSMYLIYLLTGSDRIDDPANLWVPALGVAMLYIYHLYKTKSRT